MDKNIQGIILQINTRPQTDNHIGLPKACVDTAYVKLNGLEGDYNNYRKKILSNDLDRAILIFPIEMITKLNDEGWQINPGDLGENITSQGLDYKDFTLGSQYMLGDSLIEITKPCVPCHKLATLPDIGKERIKEFVQAIMNRRGWFAKVIKEGLVNKGDFIKKII